MNPRRLVAALVAGLTLALGACGGDDGPTQLSGFERSPAPSVADLALPEVGAGEFGFQADADELLVVYFGYTSCPDVCPTTLSDLRRALDDLGDDADRVSVAMATIDPGRDTDEVISGYLTSFIADAHPLRTEDDAALRDVTDVFGADYAVEALDDGDFEVAHTGSLYAIDDQGQLVVTWPFGTRAEDLRNDMELLLERST